MSYKRDDPTQVALERLLEAAHDLTHPNEDRQRAWGQVYERELAEKVRVAYREFEQAEEQVAA